MAGTIWAKFYWSDWQSDPALKLCSLAAQGLWMRMLCIAAESDPTGYVAVNGRPLGVTDIARLAGVTETECEPLLQELALNGVFSRTARGCIYSRRLVRDAKTSARNQKNGKSGGNPTLSKQRGISEWVNPPDKPPDNPPDKPHMPEARNQKENKPPPPSSLPGEGGGDAELTRRCVAAIGFDWSRPPSQAWLTLPVKIGQWLRNGCTADDVIDGVRTVMAKRKSGDFPSSPAYFDKAVLRQRDERLALNGAKPTAADWGPDDPAWRSLVKAHQDGVWFEDQWGPRIGQPGCRVPGKFLEKPQEAA
jgi:hypothetical protein